MIFPPGLYVSIAAGTFKNKKAKNKRTTTQLAKAFNHLANKAKNHYAGNYFYYRWSALG